MSTTIKAHSLIVVVMASVCVTMSPLYRGYRNVRRGGDMKSWRQVSGKSANKTACGQNSLDDIYYGCDEEDPNANIRVETRSGYTCGDDSLEDVYFGCGEDVPETAARTSTPTTTTQEGNMSIAARNGFEKLIQILSSTTSRPMEPTSKGVSIESVLQKQMSNRVHGIDLDSKVVAMMKRLESGSINQHPLDVINSGRTTTAGETYLPTMVPEMSLSSDMTVLPNPISKAFQNLNKEDAVVASLGSMGLHVGSTKEASVEDFFAMLLNQYNISTSVPMVFEESSPTAPRRTMPTQGWAEVFMGLRTISAVMHNTERGTGRNHRHRGQWNSR